MKVKILNALTSTQLTLFAESLPMEVEEKGEVYWRIKKDVEVQKLLLIHLDPRI